MIQFIPPGTPVGRSSSLVYQSISLLDSLGEREGEVPRYWLTCLIFKMGALGYNHHLEVEEEVYPNLVFNQAP